MNFKLNGVFTLKINMQTTRRKEYKQYLFTGVLLLSLSANIIRGTGSEQDF